MIQKIFSSPLGDLLIIVHRKRVVYVNWVHKDCLPKLNTVMSHLSQNSSSLEDVLILEETLSQLHEYFLGKRKSFTLPLAFQSTDFYEKVWRKLIDIPYGSFTSYKELAEKTGNVQACRAVAKACGANPIAIIVPCHRVISSIKNNLGGYTGGTERKIALLNLENYL